jgi:diacylglycerol kinase family enzyme
MYQYIYDHYLSDKKYDKILAKIEARIIDLGIQGKINKITLLKNFETYVQEIAGKKPEALVIVGNDETVAKILNIVAEKELVLGIIPVGEPNVIARYFGIGKETAACEIISARKIKEIDLGKINGQFFMSSVEVFGEGASVICNDKFEIKALKDTEKIGIYNLCLEGDSEKFFNPQDSALELISLPKETRGVFGFLNKKHLVESMIKVKKAKILSSPNSNSVLVDGHKTMKTPAEVTLADKKLRVIVGGERKF